jgi:hypothetical protein
LAVDLAIHEAEVLTLMHVLQVETAQLLVGIDIETEAVARMGTIVTMAVHREETMDITNAEGARVGPEAEALEDTVILIETMLVEGAEIAQEIDTTEDHVGIVDHVFIRVLNNSQTHPKKNSGTM